MMMMMFIERSDGIISTLAFAVSFDWAMFRDTWRGLGLHISVETSNPS